MDPAGKKIECTCSSCSRRYLVDYAHAGKPIKCKACGTTVRVPIPKGHPVEREIQKKAEANRRLRRAAGQGVPSEPVHTRSTGDARSDVNKEDHRGQLSGGMASGTGAFVEGACVFCRVMPRRMAVGVCDYPMVRSINLGTEKHQRIRTESAIVPVPICEVCGRALRKRGGRITFAILVCCGLIVFAFCLKQAASDSHLLATGTWIVSLILGLLVLPVYFYKNLEQKEREAGLVESIQMANPHGGATANHLREYKQQLTRALEADEREGVLHRYPPIVKLYTSGYTTPLTFAFFPGGSIRLSNLPQHSESSQR